MLYIAERFVVIRDILSQHCKIENSLNILNGLQGVINP